MDLQIGDSLYVGDPVTFPAIPRFAPEVFASARPLDSGRYKQFRRGLDQLDSEGVVQVLRDPQQGDANPVLAAVGQLQFDVFADRLDIEFNAPTEILPSPYEAIRLTDEPSAQRLREVGGIRILARGDGRLVALFESRFRLQRLESDQPDLVLEPISVG
jgi:peptide chain release factor 3